MNQDFERFLSKLETAMTCRKKTVDTNQFIKFESLYKKTLIEFAALCEASIETKYDEDSVSVTIVGKTLVISDFDSAMKEIIMDRNTVIHFGVDEKKKDSVMMNLWFRCWMWEE
ncbi:hypothetical protein V3C10_06245 [[Clostridium] symbiosum]|uniref:hypothetical protein n=1 Tax=Clostridium symbiosum TaxID=1512 RepID=UPI001D07330F|nr:hypothetical protein [[Clostridium] symbiosum]MCB6609472.1 hypothetical protein [[Clostridium] symbiosum]MCB6929535.1 hypothetical protein [[Clostridium] symbiosum]